MKIDTTQSRYKLSEDIFNELSKTLNIVHSTKFSDRFWKLLTKDYVKAVVTRKKLLCKHKLNKKPDLYPINDFSFPSRKNKIKNGLILLIKHFKSIGLLSGIKSVLKCNNELYIGFPEIPNFEKENLGSELEQYYPHFLRKGNRVKRKKINNFAKNIDDIFLSNVVKGIPRILIEHFELIYNNINLYNPSKKIFHVHFCQSWYNLVLIAKYVEYGAKLIWYQHGYQTTPEIKGMEVDEGHKILLSCIDEYRSWGWTTSEKEVPWKAYRLEEFRNKYIKYKNSIEYDILLCFPAVNNNKTKNKYKNISRTIFNIIDHDKYKSILARPRRSNKIHSHASKLRFIQDENVKISSGLSTMMEEMSRCRIVIQMNIPSTNFLECLFVDHPTIGVLNNNNPTEMVEPYYEYFYNKGVFHDDFKSLVIHLNRINIEEWWMNLIQSKEYKNYKQLLIRY